MVKEAVEASTIVPPATRKATTTWCVIKNERTIIEPAWKNSELAGMSSEPTGRPGVIWVVGKEIGDFVP